MLRRIYLASLVFTLFAARPCLSQDKPPAKLLFKMDETVSGPHGGEKSSSCLRLYSDGRAIYASWWNDSFTTVDAKTGEKSRGEHTVSKEFAFDELDLEDFFDFLQSKPVEKLAEKFGPPHPPIDYIEFISLEFTGRKGRLQRLSTREFYVADMEEMTRYPSALLVLMQKIDEIEHKVDDKGKPADPPPDCHLKPQEGK
jgi:hypothetical protein